MKQIPYDMQTPDWWEIVDGPALSFQLVCFHTMQYMKLVEALKLVEAFPLPWQSGSHQKCHCFWNRKGQDEYAKSPVNLCDYSFTNF